MTFEEDDFLVTAQELDLDNLQGQEFEPSHNNGPKNVLGLEHLMSVEIVLLPNGRLKSWQWATMNKLQWGRIRRLKSLNLPFPKRLSLGERMMEFISYTLASAHTSSIPDD